MRGCPKTKKGPSHVDVIVPYRLEGARQAFRLPEEYEKFFICFTIHKIKVFCVLFMGIL